MNLSKFKQPLINALGALWFSLLFYFLTGNKDITIALFIIVFQIHTVAMSIKNRTKWYQKYFYAHRLTNARRMYLTNGYRSLERLPILICTLS
jgi:hypothetical protein